MNDDPPNPGAAHGMGRRSFVKRTVLGTAGAPLSLRTTSPAATVKNPEDLLEVHIEINSQTYRLHIEARETLLDALREIAGLTGTKKGCDHGQCGACTVLLDGRRVLSCLTLAARCHGRKVTTIEGLAGTADGELHPMQEAFVKHDAFQCGFCTSGQILSAVGCVHEGHAGSAAEIRESMSGNLCRCAAYPNILAAIEEAKDQIP